MWAECGQNDDNVLSPNPRNGFVAYSGRGGGMVDAADLKSADGQPSCEFESRPRHHAVVLAATEPSAAALRASALGRPEVARDASGCIPNAASTVYLQLSAPK